MILCFAFYACVCRWTNAIRVCIITIKSKIYLTAISALPADDGPYGKTKDISGPEQTMASRRHSIPGTYSSHPLVHPSSFCDHMSDMQIGNAAELSHQNNNKKYI